jgi:hypothetical protein
MRRFILVGAIALGLVALWAAILPLTAQPAPAATLPAASTAAPAMSKALFLCRTQHGIDKACAAALANALVLEQPQHAASPAADRACHMNPQTFAEIGDRG